MEPDQARIADPRSRRRAVPRRAGRHPRRDSPELGTHRRAGLGPCCCHSITRCGRLLRRWVSISCRTDCPIEERAVTCLGMYRRVPNAQRREPAASRRSKCSATGPGSARPVSGAGRYAALKGLNRAGATAGERGSAALHDPRLPPVAIVRRSADPPDPPIRRSADPPIRRSADPAAGRPAPPNPRHIHRWPTRPAFPSHRRLELLDQRDQIGPLKSCGAPPLAACSRRGPVAPRPPTPGSAAPGTVPTISCSSSGGISFSPRAGFRPCRSTAAHTSSTTVERRRAAPPCNLLKQFPSAHAALFRERLQDAALRGQRDRPEACGNTMYFDRTAGKRPVW